MDTKMFHFKITRMLNHVTFLCHYRNLKLIPPAKVSYYW